MAQPTNTFDQYDLGTSVREGLSNLIVNVDNEETPFFTGAKKGTATNQNHEWLTDSYAAAATNYAIEANDLDGDALSARTRLSNRIQISDKVRTVSELASMVNTAGVDREVAYQIVKGGVELRRDIEKMCLGANVKVTGNATTAAEAASAIAYIKSNISRGTNGTAPTGDGSDLGTEGTNRALTESLLESVVDDMFTNSGPASGKKLFCNAKNKRIINGFNGVVDQVRYDAGNKAIAAAMDIYVSDYGTITLVPDAFMRTNAADSESEVLILDMSKWGLAFIGGSAFRTKELSQGGLYDKVAIYSYWTLEALNEKSSGVIRDLNDS